MIRTVLIASLGLIISVLLTVACDKKVGKLPVKSTAINCDTITYSKNLAPIIDAKCGSGPNCHVAGGQAGIYLLTDYQKVLGFASQIDNTVFVTKSMPKAPTTLTENEKSIIRCWLDNGKKP